MAVDGQSFAVRGHLRPPTASPGEHFVLGLAISVAKPSVLTKITMTYANDKCESWWIIPAMRTEEKR